MGNVTNTISSNNISNITNGTTNTTTSIKGVVSGIYITSGANTVNNNVIYGLTNSNANNTAFNTASVTGLALSSTSSLKTQTISNNTIYNLTNNYISFAGYVVGLLFNGATSSNIVNNNFIHSLYVTGSSSTSAYLSGIKMQAGSAAYSNNIISIGGNTKTTIYGIYETGASSQTNKLYFNTVYISGSLVSGATNKSYSLYSAVTTNSRDFRNNIFYNARSTSGGLSLHYAAWFNYAVNTGLTSNYNDYFVTGIGGVLGRFNSADVNSNPIVPGNDANSMNTNPQFSISKGNGTSAADFKPGVSLTGDATTGITTDYSNYTRPSPPTLGSIEKDSPLPVTLQSFTYNVFYRDVKLNWVTSSEQNNAGFEIQRLGSRQAATGIWEKIGYIIGKGTTNTHTEYNFTDIKVNSGKYKYRLKQIDNNGNFEYHNLSTEVEIGIPSKYELSQNYPNPFNPVTKIDFQLPVDSKVTLKIYDITGREVVTLINSEFRKSDFYTVVFNGSNISSGIYFYRLVTNDFVITKKLMLIK